MDKILAVDGNSILNRAFYGVRLLTSSKGIPTNALMGFVNILLKNIDTVKPERLAIAFDRKAPTFRHAMYDKYKSNRKPMPEELAKQLPYAKEIARAMGFTVLEKDSIEADDMLGTVSALGTQKDFFCYVLTGDRDALQLINDTTSVLLATNTETVLFDRDKFYEKYLTEPENLIELKALMGDSSDCIPGVPGIGEKTAINLISKYSKLENIYTEIDSLPVGPSAKEKIKSAKELAYLSRELATIKKDVALDCDPFCEPDKKIDELRRIFTELEMFSTLTRLTQNPYYASIVTSETAKENDSDNGRCNVTMTQDIGVFQSVLNSPNSAQSFNFDNATAYVYNGENCLGCKFDSSGSMAEFISQNLSLLSVFDSKKLYKYLFENHMPVDKLVNFDASLAAYVVNSGLQKYTIENLSAYFLHMTGLDFDIGTEAMIVLRLSSKLTPELEESAQTALYKDVELPLARVIADMEYRGISVNAEGLENYGKELFLEIKELEERVYFHAGEEFNINSPKQLGAVLFEHLGLPCKKKTKSGYSTDAETLEALAPYHPIVECVLEYRALTKLKSTFIDSMLKEINERDGRIHSRFNQASTATGRLSSADPNLQNIPVRTERGRVLRKFFTAGEGKVLIDADYSQIELRLLAQISEDRTFIDGFVNGEDIHRLTASQVFGVPIEQVTGSMRSRAKAVNFGIVYGISAFSLSTDISTTRQEAQQYIDNYLARYTGVSAYLDDIVRKAKEHGYVTTLFGRRRYIPELRSGSKIERNFGERIARNSPIQGSAADVIKLAMINVYERLKDFPQAALVLQVHDELIIEAPVDVSVEISKMLKKEMESVVDFEVPLTVDVKIGKTWYDTKD